MTKSTKPALTPTDRLVRKLAMIHLEANSVPTAQTISEAIAFSSHAFGRFILAVSDMAQPIIDAWDKATADVNLNDPNLISIGITVKNAKKIAAAIDEARHYIVIPPVAPPADLVEAFAEINNQSNVLTSDEEFVQALLDHLAANGKRLVIFNESETPA